MNLLSAIWCYASALRDRLAGGSRGPSSSRTIGLTRLGRVFLLAAVAVCFLCPVLVLARAGGGGGFSGGGGGGGGGNGGGGGDLIGLLFWLVMRHPAIGVPVAIVAVVFFVISGKAGRSAHVSRTIRQGYRLQGAQAFASGLERLQQRDRAFDLDAFVERCKRAFPLVQAAWSEQNMTPARHLVSDGIYERFQLQLAMHKGACVRNIMKDVHVLSAQVVGIHSDDFFDTLHVQVSASAVDTWEDIRNGKRVRGTPSPEPFSEVWSFLRRPGAKTLAQPGLLEGYCPNCGTDLQVADSVQCGSCKAYVNSGEYDWVLTEITQTQVWVDSPAVSVPGLKEMVAKDPAFNVQHVEDKSSVVFWRLRAAEFFASDAYLKKLALPAFLTSHADQFHPRANGTHGFYADTAIGSVAVVGVELGGDDDEWDCVHVHVKWSGRFEEAQVPSLIKPAYERSQFRSHVLVLVRRKRVMTSRANTLTSAHCPGCGAPQTVNTNGACEYCGLEQNDGSTGWVLAEIQPFFAFSMRPPVPAVPGVSVADPLKVRLSPEGNERLLQCAVAVMLADGVIDPKEERALGRMAERRGIPTQRLQQLVQHVQQYGAVKGPEAGSVSENSDFLRSLVLMCLADGNVTREERALIKSLVQHMRYTEVDIDQMIRSERARLYQRSKQVIHAKRKTR